jgi:hypothetical protein
MSNLKYHYFGDVSKAYTNVVTMASFIEKEDGFDVIRFGYALSNNKDVYRKKVGKNIAFNRLDKSPVRLMVKKGSTFNEIVETIGTYISEETDNPSWVCEVIGKHLGV